MEKHLHIISFDVPYPANYGGVIDVFYKLKALHAEGIKIHPQSAELQYRMSACLMIIGQKQEALSFLHTALKLDYDLHNEIFDYVPELKDNTAITDLIESYKK